MMRRTVSVLFFIAVLSVFAADVSIGCGHGYVYGPVNQKFTKSADETDGQIAINDVPYTVPYSFYSQVQVGDWVRFDGRSWTIVKRATSPKPASPPP